MTLEGWRTGTEDVRTVTQPGNGSLCGAGFQPDTMV